jgi:ferredoxin
MVRVYVDQDLCTGSMVCESITPQVFAMDDEGLATVIDDGAVLPEGGAPAGAVIPPGQVALVRDAAAACPGGCIHIVEG